MICEIQWLLSAALAMPGNDTVTMTTLFTKPLQKLGSRPRQRKVPIILHSTPLQPNRSGDLLMLLVFLCRHTTINIPDTYRHHVSCQLRLSLCWSCVCWSVVITVRFTSQSHLTCLSYWSWACHLWIVGHLVATMSMTCVNVQRFGIINDIDRNSTIRKLFSCLDKLMKMLYPLS